MTCDVTLSYTAAEASRCPLPLPDRTLLATWHHRHTPRLTRTTTKLTALCHCTPHALTRHLTWLLTMTSLLASLDIRRRRNDESVSRQTAGGSQQEPAAPVGGPTRRSTSLSLSLSVAHSLYHCARSASPFPCLPLSFSGQGDYEESASEAA